MKFYLISNKKYNIIIIVKMKRKENLILELISEKRTYGDNPCLCWKKFSIGVQKIIEILNKNNIKYEMEKTFDTCISPLGYKLPFDFFLPKYNIIIEYDGEQHFKLAFGENENKLIKQKQYDNIKNEWCKKIILF